MKFQIILRVSLPLILVGITQLDGKPVAEKATENTANDPWEIEFPSKLNTDAVKDGSHHLKPWYEDDLSEAIRAAELDRKRKLTTAAPKFDDFYNWDFKNPDYKPYDFKLPDYKIPKLPEIKPIDYNFNTEDHSTYYYRSGVNGYHVSGGLAAFAVIILMIRCGLLCCRLSNNTRRATTAIVVRETSVQALIVSAGQRNNSVDDGLIKNEEVPADDPPPAYEDCAQKEATSNVGEDQPPGYST